MSENKRPLCFVLSPIGPAGSEIRRRADGILREIIGAAFKEKYEVRRADEDPTPGIVTDHIIGSIIDAALVVADLTGKNPNVMYELAIRHAMRKPSIHLIESGELLPFDVAAVRAIEFQADLSGREAAIAALRAAEATIAAGAEPGNPIRRAVEFRAFQAQAPSSDKILARQLEEMTALINQIRIQASPLARATSSKSATAERFAEIERMVVMDRLNGMVEELMRDEEPKADAIIVKLGQESILVRAVFGPNQIQVTVPIMARDLRDVLTLETIAEEAYRGLLDKRSRFVPVPQPTRDDVG